LLPSLQSNEGASVMIERIGAILTVVLLFGGAISPVAHAGGACDDASRLARAACLAGVTDDFSIGKGNCVNLADATARQQCVADARNARTEAQQLCRDQSHARQDLCDALGRDPLRSADSPQRVFVTAGDGSEPESILSADPRHDTRLQGRG
jgi:hypothetical protein